MTRPTPLVGSLGALSLELGLAECSRGLVDDLCYRILKPSEDALGEADEVALAAVNLLLTGYARLVDSKNKLLVSSKLGGVAVSGCHGKRAVGGL